LTTSGLNVLLSGILGYYGNQPVDVHFKINEIKDWHSFEGN